MKTIFLLFKLAAPLVLVLGGWLAWMLKSRPRRAGHWGCCSALLGAVLGFLSLFSGYFWEDDNFFRLPILLLTFAGALHTPGYLQGHGEERSGFYWLFYNLTCAAMWCVTLAKSELGFLLAWEVMGLASFALVAFEYTQEKIRHAAWIYLLACQAGALALIMMFFVPMPATMVFILGLVGFGLKIGFPLLHVWLPEAHPAAPAPVSALMSGAMIQLGFYGLFRWTPVFGIASGYTLLVLGLIAAPCAIIMALVQRNLKKLLAYSSVENMGVLALGFGLFIIAGEKALPQVASCALLGAQLHMLNHACLKGGLFLGAGSVLKACHTLDIDQMGGLLKRLPKSSWLFILNACSLAGLPPFNGFLSEFLLYLAAVYAVSSGNAVMVTTGAVVLIILALTGGIAAAVYAKAIGGVFLGEPRSSHAAEAKEVSCGMQWASGLLWLGSVSLIIIAPLIAVAKIPLLPEISVIMTKAAGISVAVVLLFIVIGACHLIRGIQPRRSITWDCGYAKPSARMEYTGSAFSQPLAEFFAVISNFRQKYSASRRELFPQKAQYQAQAEDSALQGFWNKLFTLVKRFSCQVHALQSGSLHFYILVMTLALIALLIWGLLLPWGGTLLKGGF